MVSTPCVKAVLQVSSPPHLKGQDSMVEKGPSAKSKYNLKVHGLSSKMFSDLLL